MKKILTLLTSFGLIAALTLSACGAGATTAAETTAAAASEAASEAVADESWIKVEKAGKLIMGLDDSFPPMGFRDEKNEIVGYDIDLAKEVAKRLNIELELLPIDWKMKENELQAGNVDVLWNGYSITPVRAKDNSLSAPYLANDQVVVVLSKSGIKDLAGMAGKKLALQEESSAEQALDAATDFKASLAEVIPFKDNVTAFLDVQAGGSDALLVDKVVADYYVAQQANPADYTILSESLLPEEYAIGFRKADLALKDKVEETLRAMKEDGKLSEITTKWFGSDISIFK